MSRRVRKGSTVLVRFSQDEAARVGACYAAAIVTATFDDGRLASVRAFTDDDSPALHCTSLEHVDGVPADHAGWCWPDEVTEEQASKRAEQHRRAEDPRQPPPGLQRRPPGEGGIGGQPEGTLQNQAKQPEPQAQSPAEAQRAQGQAAAASEKPPVG